MSGTICRGNLNFLCQCAVCRPSSVVCHDEFSVRSEAHERQTPRSACNNSQTAERRVHISSSSERDDKAACHEASVRQWAGTAWNKNQNQNKDKDNRTPRSAIRGGWVRPHGAPQTARTTPPPYPRSTGHTATRPSATQPTLGRVP
jgi:hypothetical protein